MIGWLTTVTPDGQPQTFPVWFLWEDGEALVYSDHRAKRNANIATNPRVSLHLADNGEGGDVVVIEGEARVDPTTPPVDRARRLPRQVRRLDHRVPGLGGRDGRGLQRADPDPARRAGGRPGREPPADARAGGRGRRGGARRGCGSRARRAGRPHGAAHEPGDRRDRCRRVSDAGARAPRHAPDRGPARGLAALGPGPRRPQPPRPRRRAAPAGGQRRAPGALDAGQDAAPPQHRAQRADQRRRPVARAREALAASDLAQPGGTRAVPRGAGAPARGALRRRVPRHRVAGGPRRLPRRRALGPPR